MGMTASLIYAYCVLFEHAPDPHRVDGILGMLPKREKERTARRLRFLFLPSDFAFISNVPSAFPAQRSCS